jgi:hypothetical protein
VSFSNPFGRLWIIPYPIDYQTADIELFADWPDVAANLAGIGVVLKEWVGLVAYYAMDRTDELFPGPDNWAMSLSLLKFAGQASLVDEAMLAWAA